jgi:hypothetical protein
LGGFKFIILLTLLISGCNGSASITYMGLRQAVNEVEDRQDIEFDGIEFVGNITDSSAKIFWTPHPDAEYYELYLVTGAPEAELIDTIASPASSFQLKDLINAKQYTLRLIVKNSIHDKKDYSFYTLEAPGSPGSIKKISPLVSASLIDRVSVVIEGLKVGDTVKVYSDNRCHHEVGSSKVTHKIMTLTTDPLPLGKLAIHARAIGIHDNPSTCSVSFFDYERKGCPDGHVAITQDREFCVVEQPKRALSLNGTDQFLRWTRPYIGELYASYYDIESESWINVSLIYNDSAYILFPSTTSIIHNLKLWTDNLATINQRQAISFDEIPANLWGWYKLDENSNTTGFDSSGQRHHATLEGHPSSYSGVDVPHSWHNTVGYQLADGYTYHVDFFLSQPIQLGTLIPRDEFRKTDFISYSYQGEADFFVLTVKTDNPGTSGSDQFTLPTAGTGYYYSIDWGDGSIDEAVTGSITHTFAQGAGTYRIQISGVFPKIYFNNVGDREKLIAVQNWGEVGFSNNQFNAFHGCVNLKSIPDGASWFTTITNGQGMFAGSNLSALPEGMTLDALTNGQQMFDGNHIVTLPQNMPLSSLIIGLFMFRGNPLTALSSNMTLNSLVNGMSMFSGASLTTLPETMTLNVLTNGQTMFVGNQLTSLPESMTLNALENGGEMFMGNNLTSLPANMTLSTVTDGGRMFHGNSLNGLPTSMTLNALTNGQQMFDGNHIVTLPQNMPLSSLVIGLFMFRGNPLTALSLNMTLNSLVNGMSMFSGASLTTLPETMTLNVLTNGQTMFVGNQLTSLPESMTLNALENGGEMFMGNNLTSLPANMTLSTVTDGGRMFHGNSLNGLPSNMTLNALTNGQQMFQGSNIMVLPEEMTLSSLISGFLMFSGNPLSALSPNMTLDSLENGVSMFHGALLTSLPETLTLNSLVNGQSMFFANQLISLPENITLASLTNGYQMFYGNGSIALPLSVRLMSLVEGAHMFFGCSIDTDRYSQLLMDMEVHNPNNNVSFSGGSSKYNYAAQTARNNLILRSWSIIDGGLE